MKSILLMILALGISQTSKAGGVNGGGGEGIASHYYSVSVRALNAVKFACKGLESPPAECRALANLELSMASMKVVPRSRDTIVGVDGSQRDAGNDGFKTVFLDVDRWSDKQNETNQNKIIQARTKQIQLVLHEPLVLSGAEANDQYSVSGAFIELLVNNNFDVSKLVADPVVSQTSELKYQVKYFEGSSTISARIEIMNEAAEAEAVTKASGEGYFDCKKVRAWISVPFFNGGAEAHIQIKCQKPS